MEAECCDLAPHMLHGMSSWNEQLEQGCQQSTMKWLMKWLNEEIDSIDPK
jgi:hypothetical protein